MLKLGFCYIFEISQICNRLLIYCSDLDNFSEETLLIDLFLVNGIYIMCIKFYKMGGASDYRMSNATGYTVNFIISGKNLELKKRNSHQTTSLELNPTLDL